MGKLNRRLLRLKNYRKLPTLQLESSGMYFDFEMAQICDDKMDPSIYGECDVVE